MNGSIRIIGGKWRGRKLPVLNKDGLRPTADRVKETLFNWLMPVIQDSDCLDCFSGSGSLGFEAASRGAKRVILLEKDRLIANQLEKNNTLINNNIINIQNVDTLSWLDMPAISQFDIVFIDPPFHKALVEKAVTQLENNNWLKETAYIYIETEINHSMMDYIPTNWHLHREKKAGMVQYCLFLREQNKS